MAIVREVPFSRVQHLQLLCVAAVCELIDRMWITRSHIKTSFRECKIGGILETKVGYRIGKGIYILNKSQPKYFAVLLYLRDVLKSFFN